MPTPLSRQVMRAVEGRRGTRVVVRLTPEGLMLREHRRRQWYGPLDYGALLIDAVRRTVDLTKQERKRRKR
jgi:hypothetical protein